MTDPPSQPPADDEHDEFDDWDEDWNERRFLGMQPRSALLVIMAVGVVAAIVAIAVVAVTSSGRNSGQTQAATGVPTGSPSQVPAGQVTCSVITADPNLAGRYTFVPTPLSPPDVPLPTVPPARQCTGHPDKGNAPDVVALIWPGAEVGTYRQQLIDADWTFDDVRGAVSFFSNPSSAYEIAMLEVNGALVALYDQG